MKMQNVTGDKYTHLIYTKKCVSHASYFWKYFAGNT